MWWFDVTPTGRIVARVTEDQNSIDSSLPNCFNAAASNLLTLFAILIMISIVLPYFSILAFILALIFTRLLTFYLNGARDVARFEDLNKAPIFTHF